MSTCGRLVSFSGIDGAGKTTQINTLMQRLKEKKYSIVYLWSRGGYTRWFDYLKKSIRKASNGAIPPSGHSLKRDKMISHRMIGRVWLFLAILDLIRLYGANVRWQLLYGNIVICDRYLWDTLIDFKINFPAIKFEDWFIWRLLVYIAPVPDMSIFFYIPLNVSEQRSLLKSDPFPETIEKRTRRHYLYSEITNTKANWDIIDGLKPIQEIACKIWKNFSIDERNKFK